MRFNMRLTEYNNTATIAIFKALVGFDDEYEKPEITRKKEKPVIGEKNPFTGEIVEEEIVPDPEDVFREKQDTLAKSVQRSKRNVLRLIRSMDLSNAYFVTLTFDKEKVNRTDFNACCKKTRIWLQNLRKQPGAENMSFLCVPELHKDMVSWHSHCILCNVGDIKLIDSKHKDHSGRTIYNLENWRYGFSTAVKISSDPKSSIKLAKYVTKYFTKESGLIAHNKHRYFASQNIPKPKVREWVYDKETDIPLILEDIYKEGYQKVGSSYYEGFVDIEYIETIKIGENMMN